MARILVVGGYGGFGGRLSRRLAGAGHEVLVGGRTRAAAEEFCANLAGCRPVVMDRTGDVASFLKRERPEIVIDASGPFQSSDYRMVDACLECGVHYLDLSDDRRFVVSIGKFDERARRAGISIISGASSVPALSHAVIDKLALGLDRVTAIEVAITASSRASAGNSVAYAILSGVGRPLDRWLGGRWSKHYGWQSIRSERFQLPSGHSLGRRLIALADVPDLQLLPERIAGISAVTFRAGTESHVANLGLWLASWFVRFGLIRSMASASGILVPLHRLTALWGGDRSGMQVRIWGASGSRRLEKRWTLIADRGDGPEIPALASAILADQLANGELAPGARHAGGLLTLEQFERSLATLSVRHEVQEIDQLPPLYARVMGGEFNRLSPALRSVHDVLRDGGTSGRATVERGSNWLSKWIASLMRFPPAGEHDVHVHFAEVDGVECWSRDFGGHRFRSRLSQGGTGCVVERFGPLKFRFHLNADQGALAMQLLGWSLGPIPLPRWLAPSSPAREWEADGLFHFDVPIDLPLVGRIVRYRGWLRP